MTKLNMEQAPTTEGPLKICLVATYPPRECGIATFTCDLHHAVIRSEGVHSFVIAVTSPLNPGQYPSEVAFEIRQNQLRDYRLAAEYVNFSGAQVVCLQHEFGIFGGAEGRYVTDFLNNLRPLVVTTLHTVMSEPERGYRETLVRIAEVSSRLVVMSRGAGEILRSSYGIPESKITMIHHGVPDVPFIDPNYHKDKFGVEGRLVLLTFGLLNRNKGIETVLEALPEVVRHHPEVIYIVLGATHPEVKARHGEEYRLSLGRRVRELRLEDHVLFHDRYVSFQELCEFIGACDIYVTPYRSREQIVSGTLAYSVGMGKAVVSTPYCYAEELLESGRGKLVDFGDSSGMARILVELMENEALRHQIRKCAYEYGRQMTWREVGGKYVELFGCLVSGAPGKTTTKRQPTRSRFDLPSIKLDHLIKLTDDTGIIQHAAYGVPDRRTGYSTDDVGRALAAVLGYHQQFADSAAAPLATKYLSFLQLAQLQDGRFHNFMDYGRNFTDKVGSEDTLGRALWGLGVAVAHGHNEGARALAREMFERSLDHLELEHPRAAAYAICGLHAFLRKYGGAALVRRKLEDLADGLAGLFARSRTDDWSWFGEELTYANAKIPQAMLLAYQVTEEERFLSIGLETLDFLVTETFRGGCFDFIGNKGWCRRGCERAIFDQQTIEAGYTAEACVTAAEITGASRYLEKARAAVEWFLGRNRLAAPLYDLATGACADGFGPQGPSMNQGAESVICCILGLLAVSRQSEKRLEEKNTVFLGHFR
ncbi:MAG: glycosyltransferase [Armatimonadetes bacterium]|nr:glycosyltransferase [Armatimonadota bacterium]